MGASKAMLWGMTSYHNCLIYRMLILCMDGTV